MTSLRHVLASLAIGLFVMTASYGVSAQTTDRVQDAAQKIELENAQNQIAEWDVSLDGLEEVLGEADIQQPRVFWGACRSREYPAWH